MLDFYEVEDRLVAVDWRHKSGATAWAWSTGFWRSAPGLVGKASAEGYSLTPANAFAAFPEAFASATTQSNDVPELVIVSDFPPLTPFG